MKNYVVITVLGSDRPGIVSALAEVVVNHGGSWLESRMARLTGQFAGIARIECPAESADALLSALHAPILPGLTIHAIREDAVDLPSRRTIVVDVLGQDRPGIVREFTAAVSQAGGNVEELTTGLESAPMTGQPMFRAHGIISIPENTDTTTVTKAIESLGGDLTVDLSI